MHGAARSQVVGPTRRRRFIAQRHHCGPPEARFLRAPHPTPEVPWPYPDCTRSDRVCSTP